MPKFLLPLVALLAFCEIAQAQPVSWEVSFVPGVMDGNGHFLGGTEIRELIPWHNGGPDAALYAGNGYWLEQTPGPEGRPNAQVLVLNSSHGFWQQDVDFGQFCPTTAPKCALATAALDKLNFVSDKNGTPAKVTVLVASTWDTREPKPVNVFTKNNNDGQWSPTTLVTVTNGTAESGSGAQVRSFGIHVDAVTQKDWAFAGEAPTGIFHGLLSDKLIIGIETFLAPDTIPQPGRPILQLDEPNLKLEGDAYYFMREAASAYELIPIPAAMATGMGAVRAVAVSPFADECNAQGKECAVYFGGFDANKSTSQTLCVDSPCTFPPLVPYPTHDTGWIVKGIGGGGP